MALAEQDPLDAVLGDWRKLSTADKAAIRARLSADEQRRLDRMLAPALIASPPPQPKPKSLAEVFLDCSPQLAKRLNALVCDNDQGPAGSSDAVRDAVRQIVSERRENRP